MSTASKHFYTLDEYLALERASDTRYEFYNGEIFAMSGGSLQHDVITGNAYNALRAALQGKNCRVFTGNMQIKVPAALPYRYPDVSVVCGPIQTERFNGNDLLVNPTLLVEVLSSTTEGYDRGDKFTFYKSIPNFREYLLLAQHRPHVAQFVRQPDGKWLHTEVNELGAGLYLPSLDCTLSLNDVYEGIEFAQQ